MVNPMDTMNQAMGMAATGVGLGILSMGAMVPIKMMNKMADETSSKRRRKGRKKKMKGVVLPKVRVAPKKIGRKANFEFETPKIPSIKI